MRLKRLTVQIVCCAVFSMVAYNSPGQEYNEKYRPQFHYTAPAGWIGDPCALIKYDSTYHLFTWGHAVSKDLVQWQQLPWPLKGGDGTFDYFTGSVVVDKSNTAGFGANSMIAFYTIFNKKTKNQSQGLSHSNDYRDFNYYKGNPVLDIGSKEFRDPQVFWYAPQRKWIMVVALAVDRKVSFYSSNDLKSWTYLSKFGQIGAQEGVWECPDLIELPVDGNSNNKKWFLSIATGPNKQEYFVGNFDGTRFKLDPDIEFFLRQGKGMDGVVFEGFNSRPYRQGWRATGTAFGLGPNQSKSTVRLGAGHINSFRSSYGGDSATGTLTSPTFKIEKKAINFLIGGGNHADSTCIILIIDNKVVRTATGDNSGYMKWMGWSVADLIGKTAKIKIVDNHTGSWGHIEADQIMFSDILHNERREHALWSEYGSDFYAAKSCRDFDNVNGRTTWLGWMSNWEYAGNVPTWGGSNNRGMESISRIIGLKTYKEGIRLKQTPIPEMEKLRKKLVSFSNKLINSGTENLEEFKPAKNTYEIEASFNTNTNAVFGFNVCVGDGRKLVIGYDPKTSNLFIDRTSCSDFKDNANFNKTFPKVFNAPVTPENDQIKLHLYVDQSSIEIFTNGGKVLTALTYPGKTQTGIQVFSNDGKSTLVSFKAWELSSIWNTGAAKSLSKF